MDTPWLLVDMVVNAPIMQVVQDVRVSQVLVAKITHRDPRVAARREIFRRGQGRSHARCVQRQVVDILVVTQWLSPMVQVFADHGDSPVAVH